MHSAEWPIGGKVRYMRLSSEKESLAFPEKPINGAPDDSHFSLMYTRAEQESWSELTLFAIAVDAVSAKGFL